MERTFHSFGAELLVNFHQCLLSILLLTLGMFHLLISPPFKTSSCPFVWMLLFLSTIFILPAGNEASASFGFPPLPSLSTILAQDFPPWHRLLTGGPGEVPGYQVLDSMEDNVLFGYLSSGFYNRIS